MVANAEPEKDSGLGAARLTVALLSGAGAIETAAISASKLSGGDDLEALCFAGGSCADVLNSPWASVSGVPLAVFGALSYATVTALALAPLAQADDEAGGAVAANTALLGMTAAMAAFSSCLMLLLALVIQQPCSLCIASAVLSGASSPPHPPEPATTRPPRPLHQHT